MNNVSILTGKPIPTSTPLNTPTPNPTVKPTIVPTKSKTATPHPQFTKPPFVKKVIKQTSTPTKKPTATPTPNPVHYSESSDYFIDLGKDSIQILINKKATITPSLISLKNRKSVKSTGYTWSSSNKNIATVNSKGVITAKAAGSAVITCRDKEDRDVYTQITVKVIIPVSKITVYNDIKQLTGTVGETYNNISKIIEISPANATNKKLKWTVKSKNTNTDISKQITQKDDNFTFLRPGTYTFTASTTDGSKKKVSFIAYIRPQNKVTLYFSSKANAEWENASSDRLNIHFQVSNYDCGYTVKAFELYIYATDVWGNRIYGDNTVYYWTTEKNVQPGRTAYCDYVTIPNRSKIDKVYCGIHKVMYTDGATETIDTVQYTCWSLKE